MERNLKSKYNFLVRLVQFVKERARLFPVPALDDPLSLFTLPFVTLLLPARRRPGKRCESQQTLVSDEEQLA